MRLRGLAYRGHLFTDRTATLNPVQPFQADAVGQIAIYPNDAVSADRKPAMVEIVGKLGSCSERAAAARAEEKQEPGMIIMLTGFCHMTLENFVDPVSLVVTSHAPITRLTEKEVPPDRRRLIDPPADLPDRAAKIAFARTGMAALASGDEAAFLRLHNPDIAAEMASLNGKAPSAWLKESIGKAHAAFRDQAGQHGPFTAVDPAGGSQERAFVDRENLDFAKTNPQMSVSVTVCWCKTADCKDKWPVVPADAADNLPDRPYVCVTAYDYNTNKGPVRTIDTSSKVKGLAEPDWSRYQAAQ